MNCDFNNPQRTCQKCGYVAKKLPTYRKCEPVVVQPRPLFALGDAVERLLTRVGITKDRVERWTRTEGAPGGCGCEGRRKWLNEWGYARQREIAAAIRTAARVGGFL